MGLVDRIREIIRFRHVLVEFIAQDLKMKYRRSILGFLWSLLNPLLMMAVLALAFSLILRIRMENYAIYLLSSLTPWACFAGTVEGCCSSIIGAEGHLKRQYFPKLLFPLRGVGFNGVMFVLSLSALLILSLFLGLRPTISMVILPVSIFLLVTVSLGLGAILAAATVYFRDLQHLIGVLFRAWFYLTPIIYPMEMIPERFRFYFALNPMYYFIRLFTQPIHKGVFPDIHTLAVSGVLAFTTLFVGVAFFFHLEDRLIFRL